jgi:S-adenosylmethionine hydrolase
VLNTSVAKASGVVALLTDYGLQDAYAGTMKGAILSENPAARIVDLTHDLPPQDVREGSRVLAAALPYFPAGTVFVAVVDPGVGTDRAIVGVETDRHVLLAPDNGLLGFLHDRIRRKVRIAESRYFLKPLSQTFHGRDIFAPAAAHLARGMAVDELGPAVDLAGLRTVELPGPMVAPGVLGGRVVAIDGFGNVQMNITPRDLEAAGLDDAVQIGTRVVPRVGTFADAGPGDAAAFFIDSQGYLALAVNGGSAAQAFGLSRGDTVVLGPPDEGS